VLSNANAIHFAKEKIMASIRREMLIDVASPVVWSALRDVGTLHTRLVTGFVTDCKLVGDTRTVTFANGLVAAERIVTIDDNEQRVVWSASGGRLTHHNASAQVFAEGNASSRVVWICDLTPDDMAPAITAMIEQGLVAMKATLERTAGG
jgi:carbon monoxide dehydrogenase subunit G